MIRIRLQVRPWDFNFAMIFSTSPPGSTTIASKDSESPGVEGNTGGRFQKSKISNCGVAHCVSAQWNCNFICLFFNHAQHVFCMSILGDAGEGGRETPVNRMVALTEGLDWEVHHGKGFVLLAFLVPA